MQCALINFYAQRGDTAQCEAVFDDAVECASPSPSLRVWHSMFAALGRNGDGQRAKALLERSQRGAVPLEMDRFVAMSLLLAFGRCGMAADAHSLWTHEIEARAREDLQCDAHVVASLVDCFARKGWLHCARRKIK